MGEDAGNHPSTDRSGAAASLGLSLKRKAAIRKTQEIATQLARDVPEIADLYRQQPRLRRADIARLYIPDEYEINQEIATGAVGQALRRLMPGAELDELVKLHKDEYEQKRKDEDYYTSKEHRQRSRKGGQARTNIEREQMAALSNSMNKAQGRTVWSAEEKAYVLRLVDDPDYRHQSGRVQRYPDYQRIADEVNERFHTGKEVRTARSVSINVRDWRIQSKT